MCEHEPNVYTRILALIHNTPVGDWFCHRTTYLINPVTEVFCWAANRAAGLPCGACELDEVERELEGKG